MQEVAVRTNPQLRPRTALRAGLGFGLLLLAIGLIVGFSGQTVSRYGGASCGSVLGGGGSDFIDAVLCDKALSTPTMWTVLLLVAGALLVVTGLVIDAVRKSGDRAT